MNKICNVIMFRKKNMLIVFWKENYQIVNQMIYKNNYRDNKVYKIK
jgi:hypothetical protein